MRSATVMIEWPATHLCVDTTAVIAYLAGQLDQKGDKRVFHDSVIHTINILCMYVCIWFSDSVNLDNNADWGLEDQHSGMV